MMNIRRQYGFTFIELMIVVTIIGILASTALPVYGNYFIRAKVAESFALVTPIEKTIGDYYAYTGKLPANNHIAGLPEPEQLRGQYVNSITLENGAIHIRMAISQLEQQNIITIRPAMLAVYPPNATLVWYCGQHPIDKNLTVFGQNKTTVIPQYLPDSCQ